MELDCKNFEVALVDDGWNLPKKSRTKKEILDEKNKSGPKSTGRKSREPESLRWSPSPDRHYNRLKHMQFLFPN